MPPTARLVTHTQGAACHEGICIARERRQGGIGLIQDYNSPVWVGAGGLLLGGDDGLQVLLSALLTRVLAAVGRGSVGDLLGLFDRSLLDPV